MSAVLEVSIKYNGVVYQAELYKDIFESGGKGKSILFESEWLTPNDFEIRVGSKAKKYLSSIKCQGKPLRYFVDSGELKRKRSIDMLSCNSLVKSPRHRRNIKHNKPVTRENNANSVLSSPLISENQIQTEKESSKDMEKESEDDSEDIINHQVDQTIDKDDENILSDRSMEDANKIAETMLNSNTNYSHESTEDTLNSHEMDNDEISLSGFNDYMENVMNAVDDDNGSKDNHESSEVFLRSPEMNKDENFLSSFNDSDSTPEITDMENEVNAMNDGAKESTEVTLNSQEMDKETNLLSDFNDCDSSPEITDVNTVEAEDNSDTSDETSPDPNEEVKICLLCNPNTHHEIKATWLKHLIKVHFKKEFQSEINKNTQNPNCCSDVDQLVKTNSSKKELHDHFISWHGLETVEPLYEKAIIQKENSDLETGDVSEVVEVLHESNQNERLLQLKSINAQKNSTSEEDGDKLRLKTEKCEMCGEIIWGVGDERFNENWYDHLHRMHLKKELVSEVKHRMKEDTAVCNACDFTSNYGNNLANHIVTKHRNEIIKNLYANKVLKETVFDVDDDSQDIDKDENSRSKIENDHLDSHHNDNNKDEDEVVVINDDFPIKDQEDKKPTTLIKIQIDGETENRILYIAKPLNHLTLLDVKKHLEKKNFFKVLKDKNLEFYVKYIDDIEGTRDIVEIKRDNWYLPNINGKILMECWSS